MKNATLLRSTDDVIDALGGNGPTGLLVATSAKAVSNWRKSQRGRFPAETYLALTHALTAKGLRADPSLWAMVPASKLPAVVSSVA